MAALINSAAASELGHFRHSRHNPADLISANGHPAVTAWR